MKSKKPLGALERRARVTIKSRPAFQRLDRQKRTIEKQLSLGKIPKQLASDLKLLIRLAKQRHLNNEICRQLIPA